MFIEHLKLVFPDTKMCFKMTEIKSMALASIYTQRSVKIIEGLETSLIWESNVIQESLRVRCKRNVY